MRKIVVGKEEDAGGTVILTFRFKALGQLLDEQDPTPLPHREMTGEAEEALAGYLDEYPVSKSASLILELPEGELEGLSPPLLVESVRHHFGFRVDDLGHDLKLQWREGRYSLVLALVNLSLLLLFVYYITVHAIPVESPNVVLVLGILTIMNWATIWDTYEHFFYEYRNLARKRRIYRKITRIPVEIRGY
jgi:hypothetical protein